MAWKETTLEQYKCPQDRFETHVPDAEWQLVEELPPPPSRLSRSEGLLA